MTMLTISKLSKLIGLPPKTIRFYESSGVIQPTKRGENGYRLFGEGAVSQLQLIKQARDLGLPISEIKKLMIGCEEKNCEHTREYLESEISNYVDLLESKIAQFTLLKSKLENLKNNICADQTTCTDCSYCCNILHQLSEESKGGEFPMKEKCTCCGPKCKCKECQC